MVFRWNWTRRVLERHSVALDNFKLRTLRVEHAQPAIATASSSIILIAAALIGTGSFVPSYGAPASKKGAKPPAPSKPQSEAAKAKAIAAHLAQGEKYWENNQVEAAVGEWKAVLKLDPDNIEASDMLQQAGAVPQAPPHPSVAPPPPEDPVKHRADVVAGTKDALVRYSKAASLPDFIDVLEDRTADEFGKALVIAYQDAIQTYESGSSAADPTIYDQFESFIDQDGVAIIIQAKQRGQVARYATDRLHGRALAQAMLPWIARASKCRLDLIYLHPAGWERAADSLDKDTFTEAAKNFVLPEGPSLDDGTPFAVTLDGDKWRICPRQGQMFDFGVRIDTTKADPRRHRH